MKNGVCFRKNRKWEWFDTSRATVHVHASLTHGVFFGAWAVRRASQLLFSSLFEKITGVSAQVFRLGAPPGVFGGVSVGVSGDLCLSLLCWDFSHSNAPQMESSSVLKRPSDSSSALFSVTPRDRSVYASGTVRSAAPRTDEAAHTSPHPRHGQLACRANAKRRARARPRARRLAPPGPQICVCAD